MTPTTKAGKRLLAEMERLNFASGAKADPSYAQRIAAIETEAAAGDALVKAAQRMVDVTSEPFTVGDKTWPKRYDDAREALRAALAGGSE